MTEEQKAALARYGVEYRRRRKASGRCLACNGRARPGFTKCEICAVRASRRQYAYGPTLLPETCPCGQPRASRFAALCAACFTAARRKQGAKLASKLFAGSCSTSDGFVVLRTQWPTSEDHRLIDIAKHIDSGNHEPEVAACVPVTDMFDGPAPCDDDWRETEIKFGASVPYWLDPKDHTPPSWNR